MTGKKKVYLIRTREGTYSHPDTSIKNARAYAKHRYGNHVNSIKLRK